MGLMDGVRVLMAELVDDGLNLVLLSFDDSFANNLLEPERIRKFSSSAESLSKLSNGPSFFVLKSALFSLVVELIV